MNDKELTKYFASTFPNKKNQESHESLIEIPGQQDDQSSGVYVDPENILAIGLRATRKSPILFTEDNQEECELTIVTGHIAVLKLRTSQKNALNFSKEIYNLNPDKFAIAAPNSDILQVARNVLYLIAKNQTISGEALPSEKSGYMRALKLRFSESSEIEINFENHNRMDDDALVDARPFIKDLDNISDTVNIPGWHQSQRSSFLERLLE